MAGSWRSVRRLTGAAAAAALAAWATAAAAGAANRAFPAGTAAEDGLQAAPPAQEKPKKDPLAKLREPWPSEAELASLAAEAQALPLFQAAEPLAITIKADFNALNKDRQPNSGKRFPGEITFDGAAGLPPVPVRLNSRGHARLNVRTCDVVPLRLDFAKKDVQGTPFEGQGELKLVTHCRNDSGFEQHVLTEYYVYQLYNLFTPQSFRARLARVTYVDTGKNKTSGPRYAMLLERDTHLATRLGGRLYPVPKQMFSRLDTEATTLMAMLQYAIGNTDYSVLALHNVVLVQLLSGVIVPVGYDFDYSGLVNAPYAVADPRLRLTSVRDRLYRGPCRSLEELQPLLADFAAKKEEALARLDAVPGLKDGPRREVRDYLNDFFSLVSNPGRAKRAFVDQCIKGGM